MVIGSWTINWDPGIGDPTVGGWVTVGLYGLTALGCFAVLSRAGAVFTTQRRRQQWFWWLLLVSLAFLGINKQLDLQTLFTEIGRVVSKEQGWYNQRKLVQHWFIVGVLAVSLVISAVLFAVFWRVLGSNLLAISGFVLLLAFVLIRATSFHWSDVLIHHRILGLKVNWLLECGGLILIIFNQALLLRRSRRLLAADANAEVGP